MKYIAITQSLANWLLPKPGLISTLYSALKELAELSPISEIIEFQQNAIRFSYDGDSKVCAIWHADYLSGTGGEDWGFIKWSGEHSITSLDNIAREVLERCLYVINQRLQGLLLDGSTIHRVWDRGVHTLLAGRGSIAHQLSIGYFEKVNGDSGLQNRACLIVGPEQSFQKLCDQAYIEGKSLNKLCATANTLVQGGVRGKNDVTGEAFSKLKEAIRGFFESLDQESLFNQVQINAQSDVKAREHSRYLAYTYEEWIHPDSPLADAKRRILSGQNIDAHPLRILGPGGAGKTLLMLLLAASKIKRAEGARSDLRILYVAHSQAMADKVRERFEITLGHPIPKDGTIPTGTLLVTTLAEYCRNQLGLDLQTVLDTDGDAAKEFQMSCVLDALQQLLAAAPERVQSSPLLKAVFADTSLLRVFSLLVLVEISIAIKGHGLESDKKRYVESEKGLSLLHSKLDTDERSFIFDAFLYYHHVIFEQHNCLDPDDIAISLTGRLRTPIWQLRRRHDGFDYVFVDEAQLFNENERRLFPLLAKSENPHVPIALALDQAQATYGQASAGLSALGITGIANENLASVHRSTESIVRLAFFIIQKSTELFGPDFPDFTKAADLIVDESSPLAAKPAIEIEHPESRDFPRFILKRVRELRKANTRQIAVICYADVYYSKLEACLSSTDLPFQTITERGAKIPTDQPLVSLVKPGLVGGQEFDAVILVGLESGLIPPLIADNLALSHAVEQQAIRDIYLGITRARYRVMVAISKGNIPTKLVQQAKDVGLIV